MSNATTRAALLETAANLGLTGVSKLNKAALQDAVQQAAAAQQQQPSPEAVQQPSPEVKVVAAAAAAHAAQRAADAADAAAAAQQEADAAAAAEQQHAAGQLVQLSQAVRDLETQLSAARAQLAQARAAARVSYDNTSSPAQRKRPTRRTPEERMEALELLEQGMQHDIVAAQYNVHSSTLSDWKRAAANVMG